MVVGVGTNTGHPAVWSLDIGRSRATGVRIGIPVGVEWDGAGGDRRGRWPVGGTSTGVLEQVPEGDVEGGGDALGDDQGCAFPAASGFHFGDVGLGYVGGFGESFLCEAAGQSCGAEFWGADGEGDSA